MNIVAIIPARGGSKGIPRKNLIGFCGKPLMVWSIEQARRSKCISAVYVSSDNAEILAAAGQSGARGVLRPKAIAGDRASSEDAVLHALGEIERQDKKKVDLVVFLQATSPLRTGQDIDSAVKSLLRQKADSLFSAAKLDDYCLWKNERRWQSVNYDYRDRGRRQERTPLYLENGSIYVFKPSVLRKEHNRLGGKIAAYLMPFWQSYEIDTLPDVELCEYYMLKKKLNIL